MQTQFLITGVDRSVKPDLGDTETSPVYCPYQFCECARGRGEALPNGYELVEHFRTVHRYEMLYDGRYYCPYTSQGCTSASKQYNATRIHICRHLGLKPLMCEYAFGQQDPRGPQPGVTTSCPFRTSDNSHLHKHYVKHHGYKPQAAKAYKRAVKNANPTGQAGEQAAERRKQTVKAQKQAAKTRKKQATASSFVPPVIAGISSFPPIPVTAAPVACIEPIAAPHPPALQTPATAQVTGRSASHSATREAFGHPAPAHVTSPSQPSTPDWQPPSPPPSKAPSALDITFQQLWKAEVTEIMSNPYVLWGPAAVPESAENGLWAFSHATFQHTAVLALRALKKMRDAEPEAWDVWFKLVVKTFPDFASMTADSLLGVEGTAHGALCKDAPNSGSLGDDIFKSDAFECDMADVNMLDGSDMSDYDDILEYNMVGDGDTPNHDGTPGHDNALGHNAYNHRILSDDDMCID
ncbi:uncharacterized protein PHACADRAFT_187556 [Phanerochaete carnosa HHB-10118-sp]|uniref:Uncharacterized protein n=1 Tax=Phanerochaete carnosa (strain HHB-10118-sp) TaxID=650164 RepID=K5VWE5_PHACS|nr:uncharacterized protein PHACADRAFT_187556 [Phanerochaete carnosa HHB-10118-sp]EKM50909.1 hypothetical protein PHACADRAFT_187556 [Phanerochaete carnosa HHB-10118-sp]